MIYFLISAFSFILDSFWYFITPCLFLLLLYIILRKSIYKFNLICYLIFLTSTSFTIKPAIVSICNCFINQAKHQIQHTPVLHPGSITAVSFILSLIYLSIKLTSTNRYLLCFYIEIYNIVFDFYADLEKCLNLFCLLCLNLFFLLFFKLNITLYTLMKTYGIRASVFKLYILANNKNYIIRITIARLPWQILSPYL